MKKSSLKILLIILILFFTVSCQRKEDQNTDNKASSFTSISQDEAKRMMEEEDDIIILDVRGQDEYEEGHIPNAICIPNEMIDESVFDLLKNKDQIILVYCRSGRRSKEAAKKLFDLGYTKIYEFGGIIDWSGEIEK